MNLRRVPCPQCRNGCLPTHCFRYVTPDGVKWMPETDCCFKSYVRLLLTVSAGSEHKERAAS